MEEEKGRSLHDMGGRLSLPEEEAALIAAFTAILWPEAETVSDPQGRSAAEDGSRATILLRAAKPPRR